VTHKDAADVEEGWVLRGDIADALKVVEGWDPVVKEIIKVVSFNLKLILEYAPGGIIW